MPYTTAQLAALVKARITAKRAASGDVPYKHDIDRLLLLSSISDGVLATASGSVEIVEVTASRDLAPSDYGKVLLCGDAAITLTFVEDTLEEGKTFLVIRGSGATVAFAVSGDVTIQGVGTSIADEFSATSVLTTSGGTNLILMGSLE